MKRAFLSLLLIFCFFASKAQLITQRFNFFPTNPILEWYVTNSPGSTFGTSTVAATWQDSTAWRFMVDTFAVNSLNSSKNHGTPSSILWADATGVFRRSPISAVPLTLGQITSGLGYTPANSSGAATVTSVAFSSSSGDLTISGSPVTTSGTIVANLSTTGVTAGTYNGSIVVDSKGRITSANNESFNNTPSVTIQTVAAAGNGNQLSSTKNTRVNYSVSIVSTATISGSQSGYVVLEICSTNSSTATDWIEIGRVPNGQAVSLAVTLQSVSTGGGQVGGTVPSGYYRRLRSVNTNGTPVYSFNSGQEITY